LPVDLRMLMRLGTARAFGQPARPVHLDKWTVAKKGTMHTPAINERYLPATTRVILGAIFTVFGLNCFVHFIPMPEVLAAAERFLLSAQGVPTSRKAKSEQFHREVTKRSKSPRGTQMRARGLRCTRQRY